MSVILAIHRIFGERILPLLLVAAVIYLTVSWRPNAPRSPVSRLVPALVGAQVALGALWWIYLIANGALVYLQFPFILHPVLGLLTAGVAQLAFGRRNLFAGLGRWAPLTALAVLLALVVGNVALARLAV